MNNISSCIRLMHLMCADQVQHREWCPIMRVWLGGSDHMSAFQKAFRVLRGRGLDFSTGQICGHHMLLLDAYLDFLRASSSGSCTAEEKRQRENMSDKSKSISKQKESDKNRQADSLYSVPVMWARMRKDLDCSWAALLVQSEGPSSLVSLGMTA